MKIEAIVGIPRYDNHTEQKWIEETPVTIAIGTQDMLRMALSLLGAEQCEDCRHRNGLYCEHDQYTKGMGPIALWKMTWALHCERREPKGDDDGD